MIIANYNYAFKSIAVNLVFVNIVLMYSLITNVNLCNHLQIQIYSSHLPTLKPIYPYRIYVFSACGKMVPTRINYNWAISR